MTSRERFQETLNHQTPDRLPIDYLSHPKTDEKLLSYYGLKNNDELLATLDVDFYYLSCRDISQNESYLPIYRGPELEMTEKERICPLGIRWNRGAYNSKFAVDEAIEGPLQNAQSGKDILNHNWPKVQWFELDPFHQECELHTDRVIVGGFWSGILGDSYRMHGFQNFLMNIAMNPDLIQTLVNRMTDFYLEMNERIFSELKGKMDIWFWGNDYGGQSGLLFNEAMFESVFLPNIVRLNDLAHSHGLKVMMHSCGSISKLIPTLIESGVDILDPIQVTADNMAPQTLKDKFGDSIVFHGAIDTQQVLPSETPEGVYKHAVETLEILGKNGGFIFAPSQILQPDVPIENIDAMYRAAKEFEPSTN